MIGLELRKTPEQLREDKARASAASAALAADLAALGYPGFVYLRATPRQLNPAEVVLMALGQADLECRVVEALPWVLLAYPALDWDWLRDGALRDGLQNRLGFITNMARRVAEQRGDKEMSALLAREEAALERSRLLREDTLCHASITNAERRFLLEHRPATAKHWRLLTDIAPEHLGYAAI
ncbi:MAG: hypothetical protein HYR56_00380 [Acidobacteria bacterium]|nr:hypothetical protein [Acidobacteriota bacterium]MBI3422353.1 hypothetical protein [Acidobacteriota bacterium]